MMVIAESKSFSFPPRMVAANGPTYQRLDEKTTFYVSIGDAWVGIA
jgi:hypothetical protein